MRIIVTIFVFIPFLLFGQGIGIVNNVAIAGNSGAIDCSNNPVIDSLITTPSLPESTSGTIVFYRRVFRRNKRCNFCLFHD